MHLPLRPAIFDAAALLSVPALAGDYAFGGLISVDVVAKIRTEQPATGPLTLAGMPTGAPGMGSNKAGPFSIFPLTKDGKAPTVRRDRAIGAQPLTERTLQCTKLF